jgi:hypothetical protein
MSVERTESQVGAQGMSGQRGVLKLGVYSRNDLPQSQSSAIAMIMVILRHGRDGRAQMGSRARKEPLLQPEEL